jgi:hypothetical protein
LNSKLFQKKIFFWEDQIFIFRVTNNNNNNNNFS